MTGIGGGGRVTVEGSLGCDRTGVVYGVDSVRSGLGIGEVNRDPRGTELIVEATLFDHI